jgi:Rad3-related DNA helicase
LRETLFDERESVVLTSATLAVAGSFDYLCERVGLPRARLEELVLPSPFDFLRQAVLCLPADMPEPSDHSFEESLVDVAAQTAIALSGRTLVLFTNSMQLQACAELLRQRLRDEGIKVLAQGKGGSSRRALADRFRADAQAVLLGTNSFWEGVDLPGSALSCVVIVRLPFRPPSDPLLQARSELLRDPFVELALPEAVLRLKQGFGRLIRRATDRGAVVILDPRVRTRAYGRHFLDSLPECAGFVGPRSDIPARVLGWVEDRDLSFENEGQASHRSGSVRA